jgi:transcriptional regulator GlxA family with amidase domain
MAPPYPVRYFVDARSALVWLDVSHDTLLADLDQIREAVTEVPNDLYRLRLFLRNDPDDMSISAAAAHIGSSVRGLQRRLQELSTSFREELARARVARAQQLLKDTDLPLMAIALEVGCQTQQHFTWLFRKLTGTTPARWRQANAAPR